MLANPARRRVVLWLGATALAPLAVTPVLAEDRPPTPRLTEGPFYPNTFPRDTDADLTHVEGRAGVAQGTVLDVSGRVVDRTGRPRAGAKVEIWQCDATGQYHHVGEREGAGDDNFHVYTLNIDGTDIRRINDRGEDACSYFFPDGKRIIWTSTRDRLDLPKGNFSDPLDYPQGAELYTSNLDGSDVSRLTDNSLYEARA